MPKESGYGQLKHGGGAPGFARATGAPKGVHGHERAQARNTLDQAKSRAPNSGQTKGG